MRTKLALLLLLIIAATLESSAKFVQEVELKDGTILVGYVYRQQPSKFIVFHADNGKTLNTYVVPLNRKYLGVMTK